MAKKSDKQQQPARREFVKKAAYVAPAILTLVATPSHATVGSFKPPVPGSIKTVPIGKDE
jgi:hypothetical protein